MRFEFEKATSTSARGDDEHTISRQRSIGAGRRSIPGLRVGVHGAGFFGRRIAIGALVARARHKMILRAFLRLERLSASVTRSLLRFAASISFLRC